jgi:drug/metabolite transporter (DMT)-like permease
MRGWDWATLVVLSAIWGLSYVFIRVASPAIGPALLMEIRFGVSAGTLAAVGAFTGALRGFAADFRRDPRRYVGIGILSAALPTTLIGWAELRLTASVATVLNALVPFFAAAASARWLGEPWTARIATGLVFGFGGVLLVVGGGSVPIAPLELLAVAASVMAALSYGVGSVYIRRRFTGTPGLWEGIGMMFVASVVLAPVAGATTAAPVWPPAVIASVLGLTFLSTAIAYLLFFRLIARAGATRTTTVTFLSPVVGVLGGHFLLGEPLGPGLLLGFASILGGIALVTRAPAAPSPPAREPSAGSVGK